MPPEGRRSDAAPHLTPLNGVRVLDLSGPIGAYCTRLLADLGADVVLVEPPEGDPLRRTPPFRDDDPTASLLFAYYHASKRSVIAAPDDERRLAALGAGADVVVGSPAPGERRGGWDPALRTYEWAPRAIVCSITPFGLTGPYSWWRATPFVSFAMGGNMIRYGDPEGPPVAMPGRQLWDEAGLHAALCILGALEVLDATGPQCIDLSVHEVASWRDFFIEQYDVLGLNTLGRHVAIGYPPTGTYECADGPFDVAAHQVRHWHAFLEMLNHPVELSEPTLADAVVRRGRTTELKKTIQELVGGRSRQELVERGQAAGLPCGMLHRPTEFAADRQLLARDAIVETPSPAGPIRMPAPGAGYFATPRLVLAARTSAPASSGTEDTGWAPRATRVAPRGPVPQGVLAGRRVLSFGAFVAGNTTAMLLAQLGADVVKIEARARPEVLRMPAYAIGPLATEPSGVTNTVMYASLSRSVRNLSIDLETAGGQALFERLVQKADVVVENLGATTVERWGLSFDRLQAINPQIILTSLSGYGRTGPRASYLAYATNISNFVGLTSAWGYCHGTHSDYVTAEHAAFGTLAALRQVAKGGHGLRIDAAQIEAMAAIMPDILLEATVNGRDIGPQRNQVPGSLLSGAFRCAGHDAWLALDAQDLAEWERLCALVELPVSAASAAAAQQLWPVVEAAVGGWAEQRTALSAARELQRAGIPAGVVQNSEDLWTDPQLWSRGFILPMPQEDLGRFHYGDSAHRLSATPGRLGHVGRRLGADTVEVLEEWLELPATELQDLIVDGAAFQA